ncbi:MAG: hypothetical protein U5L10_05120 [Candidatus Moranbacteria bacterium]|nr:hypothetical protein [Candidatus Moranbacteria bacterium]
MEVIKISNLKRPGCEKYIAQKLREAGAKNIEVDFENSLVLFEGDREIASRVLAETGHPEEGIINNGNWMKRTRSYFHCLMKK